MKKLVRAALVAAMLIGIVASQSGCAALAVYNHCVAKQAMAEASEWEAGRVPEVKSGWQVFWENFHLIAPVAIVEGAVYHEAYKCYEDAREDDDRTYNTTYNDNRSVTTPALVED